MSESNPFGTVDVKSLTHISTDEADVDVRRVRTPKGTRLELEAASSEHRIRLDAVTLECITWQNRSMFAEFLAEQVRPLEPEGLVVRQDVSDENAPEITRITNEFGHVEVRTPTTSDQELLELGAPRLGFVTQLNAVALESITWQDQETFTALIRDRLETVDE